MIEKGYRALFWYQKGIWSVYILNVNYFIIIYLFFLTRSLSDFPKSRHLVCSSLHISSFPIIKYGNPFFIPSFTHETMSTSIEILLAFFLLLLQHRFLCPYVQPRAFPFKWPLSNIILKKKNTCMVRTKFLFIF